MRGKAALFVLGWLSMNAPLPAGEADIWGETILKQPFDREPFRSVRIPDWVESTLGVGYTLSVMNLEQRKKAIEAGVTISEIGFVDPLFVYYDSKLLSKRNPHVPRDRLEKEIAEYRSLGLRLLGVYPPCLQGEVYEKHPEWRRISKNTTEIPETDMEKHPHGGMLCMLGPYGDFFIDVLQEIVEKFQVDAFSFDGLHYGGFCYCQHCRENFRRDTGEEIPDVNMENAAFRRYQHWADRRMEGTIQRMQTRLKGIKPDLAIITWTTNAGRFGHFRDIPRNMSARMNLLFDAPDQELWLDETNRGGTVVPALANAYIWAVTNHRVAFSEPYLMSHGNPYGKDSFPGHEVLRRMLLPVAWGVSPSIAVLQPGHLQPAVYEALGEIRKRKEWMTHKSPEPWAALVVSDNSRVFYGRSSGQVEERYLANVLGFFRAGIEEHLPITVISDWNLTPADLARYQVLILANTACLGDDQIAAVRGFVENGGGLVATLDTSLFDELGNPRADFGLADVLGVTYRGIPRAGGGGGSEADIDINFTKGVDASYWQKRKSVYDLRCTAGSILDSQEIRKFLGGEPVTFKGPAVAVELKGKGAQAAGTIEVRDTPGSPRYPALVTRAHGKGRVAYLPAAFDASYYLYPYPYQRLILKTAIQWASPRPAPVRVEAPMCVHANVFRQSLKGERLVIHLYNDVNTTAFHALPIDDVPLREEVLPIHDIRVRLKKSYDVKQVHLEPGGIPLEVRSVGDEVEVVVPRLEVHVMVIVELGPYS